ncbi:MAG: tyrosine--tRNA ligase [Dongiaceae bacterium]
MIDLKSSYLREIVARGYLHQCTDLAALDNQAANGRVVAYVGYDATADSLHIGSLISIMMLRRLQQHGHKPIVLMGGGTTKIGDPSFRDDQRKLLDAASIDANIASIKRCFTNYLTFGDGPTDAILVNNAEWLDQLGYIELLRDVGRHFSVNRMLTFDSVKLRLEREQSLSFLEFNYMILQAYDFLELARRHDCSLQMGGSDQWGNIVNGVELGRRIEDRTLYGLTCPLLTTGSGQKMGKTATGAVWLNADRLSPYDFWQYWRNTEDADVGRFLKLFTDLPLDEIASLERLEGAGINEAKIRLANEVTALAHGKDAAAAAAETAHRVFQQGGAGDELPSIDIARNRLTEGVPIYELLREAGLASSNGDARRLVRGGGAKLNDSPLVDENRKVTLADISPEGHIKLSAGKLRHALVRAT